MALIDGLRRALQSLGSWLGRLPTWMFALLATAVFLVKVSIDWRIDILEGAASDAVSVDSFDASNFIGTTIFRLTGNSPVIYGLIAVAALVAATALLWRLPSSGQVDRVSGRTMLLWALSWPLLLADVAWLGNGFEFLPLFMVVAVLVRQEPLAVAAALLAALTHPEQAMFAFIALLILSFTAEFRFARTRAIIGTALAFASTVGTTLWLMNSGVESRTTFFIDWVADSLALYFRNFHLLTYSGWGAWWVLLLIAFGLLGRRGVQLLIVSAVLIPLAFAATTIDGTRVFAGVASAVGIAVFAFVYRTLVNEPDSTPQAKGDRSALLGMSFLAVLLLPNLQVIMWGDIVSPGEFWIDLARSLTGV